MLGGEHPIAATTVADSATPHGPRLHPYQQRAQQLVDALPKPVLSAVRELPEERLRSLLDVTPKAEGIEYALEEITAARLAGVNLAPALADAITRPFTLFDAAMVLVIVNAARSGKVNREELTMSAHLFTDPEDVAYAWFMESVDAIVAELLLLGVTIDPAIALAALVAAALVDLAATERAALGRFSRTRFAVENSPPSRMRDVGSLIAAARPGPSVGVMPTAA